MLRRGPESAPADVSGLSQGMNEGNAAPSDTSPHRNILAEYVPMVISVTSTNFAVSSKLRIFGGFKNWLASREPNHSQKTGMRIKLLTLSAPRRIRFQQKARPLRNLIAL